MRNETAGNNIDDNLKHACELLDDKYPASTPRMLITAGPTCEDIDAVRFISNRSSGRMGIALAEAALQRGWAPLLILGPTHMTPPARCACVRIRSARQMLGAVLAGFAWCDALVMAAAVADYTPAHAISGKRNKEDGDWLLRLNRTPDILAEVAGHPARPGKVVVGFSLGTNLDLDIARDKLTGKKLDLIVANTTSAFGANDSVACLLAGDNSENRLGAITKPALAEEILNAISPMLPATNRTDPR